MLTSRITNFHQHGIKLGQRDKGRRDNGLALEDEGTISEVSRQGLPSFSAAISSASVRTLECGGSTPLSFFDRREPPYFRLRGQDKEGKKESDVARPHSKK